MLRMNRPVLYLASLVILALWVAACSAPPSTSSGQAAPTTAPPSTSSGQATATSAPAATSVPAATTASSGGLGGTLRVGLTTDAESMDPYLTKQSAGLAVTNAVFDNLIERDFSGNLVPGLAISWSFVDTHTIEFKLRQGVKFQNGEDFDANSVKFSLERMQSATLNSAFRNNFKSVQTVTIVDPYTVHFNLTKTDAALLDYISSQLAMLPPKYLAQVGDAGFAKQPIGTGPFKFVEWVKDDHITLEANENYWDGSYKGKPLVKTVIFRPIPEASTRISELETGNIDLIQDVAPDQAQAVADAGFNVVKVNVPQEVFVFFVTDVADSPLAKKEVRQALNYGVDVDSIIKNVLHGYGTRFASPIGPLTLGYDANLKPYPYDPQKAKDLLTQAGYPNGFEVTIDASASDKTLTTQAVAGELAKIGVKANVQQIELAQFNDNWDKHKTDPMIAARWSGMFDPANFLSFVVKSDGFLSRYKNPQADALIAQGASTLDPAERAKTYQQLAQVLYDDPIGIYLWLPQNLYGLGKNVQGWQPHPNSFVVVSNTSVTQ